jgi:cystathionine beta-lyase
LKERVDEGFFGYPVEHPCLRPAIRERLARLYGWQVQDEEILFLPGVVVGFNIACHAFGTPGGSVAVQTPVYPPFLAAPHHAGMTLAESPLIRLADGSYTVDWDSFDREISRANLFILCNPHNPVGRVFSKDELARMAEICLSHGVPICSDEIHCDLVYTGHSHFPIAALDPEISRRCITLMAPSKTFNIPGLQFSFAVIQDPDLRTQYQDAKKGLVEWTNNLGMVAALAAYENGMEWLAELLVYLQGNRDTLVEFVRQELPGIQMAPPEGTYLAWLDCRKAGIEGSPYKFFLEKGRVALNEGRQFGSSGEGFVRLNFACPRDMLLEGLQRMKAAIDN